MTSKCKAVVFTGPRRVEVETIELPEMGEDEIGVRTLYSGISAGTELWLLTGRYWNAEFPTIPGYQKVGVVEAVGGEVKDYAVGDLVFLRFTRLMPGTVSHWGGHTSYSVISADEPELFKLPDGLDPVEGSLLCMPAVGYHGAAEVMPIREGERVVVIGLGMIGQFSAQTAQLQGASVIGLDLIDSRLDLAARYAGATTINPSRQDASAEIKKLCPDGVDAVIDTSANVDVVNESFEWLRPGGRYCFQGYYPDRTELDLLWPHINEIVMYNPTNCTPEGERQCARYLLEGKMHIKSLISHVVSVDEAPGMYEMLLDRPREAMAVVLDWQKG